MVEAVDLDAILYVLLHEATHVVDGVLNITPHFDDNDNVVLPITDFTESESVWKTFNTTKDKLMSPILEKMRFRRGKIMEISSAPDIYKTLSETPFVSLYGAASWFEDLAEMVTIYHLSVKMKQPYKIKVKLNNELHVIYEPLKNAMVKERLSQLEVFY